MCKCSGCDEMSCGLVDCDECIADKENNIMAKEWTDEEVQSAIGEAVQIVREDRIDKMLSARLKSTDNDTNNSSNDKTDSDKNGNGADKKKKSLFWGEVE